MAQKKPPVPGTTTGALTHSPFAKLADNAALTRGVAGCATPLVPSQPRAQKPPPPCKVRLRMESRGRSGKVVTRISGLPPENLGAIAARLRKGLGCGATIEDGEVILQGSLTERASEWLERAGDLRAIQPEEKTTKAAAPATATPDAARPNTPVLGSSRTLSGANRSDVRPGQHVAVVLKADQLSGKLTQGVVAELLTNSPTHPRGIKVRLESGEVGRVRVIY